MLLFYSGFVHYFNGKSLLTILMHTQFDSSKCTLAEGFAKEVTIVNILQFFKFFEIAHVQWLFAILFLPIQVSFLSRCVWIVPISAAISVHLLVVCWHRLLLIASPLKLNEMKKSHSDRGKKSLLKLKSNIIQKSRGRHTSTFPLWFIYKYLSLKNITIN